MDAGWLLANGVPGLGSYGHPLLEAAQCGPAYGKARQLEVYRTVHATLILTVINFCPISLPDAGMYINLLAYLYEFRRSQPACSGGNVLGSPVCRRGWSLVKWDGQRQAREEMGAL